MLDLTMQYLHILILSSSSSFHSITPSTTISTITCVLPVIFNGSLLILKMPSDERRNASI
ncbi:hypothetical protein E2C01_002595 [Portunus trituberculatus]|uniref:Uncharacterized protein n=1 Tax=Portunus trituberculatus TaxID=210409 RepID=A0A5B7CR64_PORTR|nr:hypothetical protein [Portunus trituberculatus]